MVEKDRVAFDNLGTVPSTRAFAPADKAAHFTTQDSLTMTPTQQPDFWSTLSDSNKDDPFTEPLIASAAQESGQPPAPEWPVHAPAMSLETAYKTLLATASSTWESIEYTRRRLVQQAHPHAIEELDVDGKKEARAAAKRVNAAYIVLRLSRET